MHMRLFGRTLHLSVWKAIGILVLFCMIGGAGLFVYQVYDYVQAIQSGEINPVLHRKLQSSVSRARANPNVTASDLTQLHDPDAPSIGTEVPELTIVEFLDYNCPFCRASFEPVRELTHKYGDRVRLIIRDFPIEDIHPGATRAALAARCAQEQNKFWAYHDKLFVNQKEFTEEDLLRFARETGLEMERFTNCLAEGRYLRQIEMDIATGLRVGVQGTPTFFFNGARIQGGLDQETLEYLIQGFLNEELK